MKSLMVAVALLVTTTVAHAQFGDLLKGLKDAAKELERGIQKEDSSRSSETNKKQPPLSSENTNSESGVPSSIRDLSVGRWNILPGCIDEKWNRFGNFVTVSNTNQLVVNQMNLMEKWGNEPRLQRKFTFNTGRVVSEKDRIYELTGFIEDFSDGVHIVRKSIVQVLQFENNYTRKTLQVLLDGKPEIQDGKIVSNGSPVTPLHRCDAPEIVAQAREAKTSQQKAINAEKQAVANQQAKLVDKGREIAKNSGVKWSLFTKRDEMSNKETRTARLTVRNQQGASAVVDITCAGMRITFEKGEVPVTRVGQNFTASSARVKVNENLYSGTNDTGVVQRDFKNVFIPVNMVGIDGVFKPKNGRLIQSEYQFVGPDGSKTFQLVEKGFVYDWMVEVGTNMGPILIKAPPFDSAIESVFNSCN
jgi:hypothetical protein